MQASAVWMLAPGRVEVRDELVPPPPAGSIRVQTIASAISHGTERLLYRGEVPPDLPLDLPTFVGSFAFPIKYGYAAVGRVIDCGADVEQFEVGDLVFALHPHQSVLVVPARFAVRLPADLNPLAGLFTANLETALNIVHDTPIRLGETALVFGQGVVGLLVTQLLRLAGAGRIITIDPIERRRRLSDALGADAALVPGPDLAEQILAVNDGRAADLAIEVSGSASALQAAIEHVLVEGTVVVASWYGTKPVTLQLGGHFHRGRIRLRSSQVGRIGPEHAARWDYARRLATVVTLLRHLPLVDLISHRVPLQAASDAYVLIDQHADQIEQVILTYADSGMEPVPSVDDIAAPVPEALTSDPVPEAESEQEPAAEQLTFDMGFGEH